MALSIDKRVPISLIFAVLVQLFAIAYFFGGLSTRVTSLEAVAATTPPVLQRLSKVEAQVEDIHDYLLGRRK